MDTRKRKIQANKEKSIDRLVDLRDLPYIYGRTEERLVLCCVEKRTDNYRIIMMFFS